jgi:DUF4097 and DUF4098 domain-containing protein YvlB
MRTCLVGLFLGVTALCLVGCDDWDIVGNSDRYKEDFHFSYPLSSGGSLQVENNNGSVEISGWDKNTVDIDGTKYASSEERLRSIRIDISPSQSSVTIRTVPPLDHRGNYGARYIIHVPRRTDLTNVTSSNGAIRVDTIEGRSHLRTSNGGIHVLQVQGTLDARTSNGTVEISGGTGDTTVHTSNGGIRAEIKRGEFEGTTSNGGINVRLLEADSKPVRLESSNGHIDLTLDAAREVHADTSNSSVTVHMPSSAGAVLHAHTTNGSISSDFDVSVRGGMLSKHRLEGTIGSGGPMLDLGTSNGSIKIVRF